MDKKLRLFFVITWFMLFFFMALGVLLYVAEDKPGPQGEKGLAGTPGVVDYQKIEEYVDSKFSQLPAARDGRNGLDGRAGRDGKDGHAPVKGVDYFDGKDGKNGLNGESPELRWNPETKSFEAKLPSDEFWTVVMDVCAEFPRLCEEP